MCIKKKSILFLLIASLILVNFTPIKAQNLILSKIYIKEGSALIGESFTGEITRYESGTITVKTGYGTFKINEDKVKYIAVSEGEVKGTYEGPCIVLKNGMVIPGKISSYSSELKKVKISFSYGEVTLDSFEYIALIVPKATETVSNKTTPTETATKETTSKESSSKVIFFDDFNDNKIDQGKWIASGNRVAEEEGIMKVEVTVSDAGGHLESKPIEIDPTKVLTITRRVNLHRIEHYLNIFYGNFSIIFNQDLQFPLNFGIFYGSDYFGGVEFFITKKNIIPHTIEQKDNIIAQIPPVWDAWFKEKIVYNPTTGVLEYFINEKRIVEYGLGSLEKDKKYTISLVFDSYSNYTKQYHYFDDLVVTQE